MFHSNTVDGKNETISSELKDQGIERKESNKKLRKFKQLEAGSSSIISRFATMEKNKIVQTLLKFESAIFVA